MTASQVLVHLVEDYDVMLYVMIGQKLVNMGSKLK